MCLYFVRNISHKSKTTLSRGWNSRGKLIIDHENENCLSDTFLVIFFHLILFVLFKTLSTKSRRVCFLESNSAKQYFWVNDPLLPLLSSESKQRGDFKRHAHR